MDNISLVNVFFVLTGSAVIIITILLAIGLIYIIMFVRTAKRVARTALKATEFVSEDLADFSKTVREQGLSFGALFGLIKSLGKKKVTRKK
ncbi:MAG TPA: hypothetical protein VHQ41_03750 [Patescibacteria group bacterium]|jgi:ABC-type transport system involved in cytochrome bd biosynthesis fused ATPase/permease subunit|nr:hypothetical protein [Patescibacteria group bacterium]